MTTAYVDLVAEVRAQVSVTPEAATRWLVDRARTMNAESQWLTKTTDLPVASETRYLEAISNAVSLDALIVGASPYERSSAHKLDALYEDTGTWWPGGGLYADGAQ